MRQRLKEIQNITNRYLHNLSRENVTGKLNDFSSRTDVHLLLSKDDKIAVF